MEYNRALCDRLYSGERGFSVINGHAESNGAPVGVLAEDPCLAEEKESRMTTKFPPGIEFPFKSVCA
jgi:hypothetical protein